MQEMVLKLAEKVSRAMNRFLRIRNNLYAKVHNMLVYCSDFLVMMIFTIEHSALTQAMKTERIKFCDAQLNDHASL